MFFLPRVYCLYMSVLRLTKNNDSKSVQTALFSICFSKCVMGSRKVYGSLVPPKFSHLYLRITCASKDHLRLRPPHLRLRAPHLRLHFFLTYASLLLIENVRTLSFHNAMILNLACYLNFIPPCPPQWLYLIPNFFLKLPPHCLPQCYHLKSNSLFKLPPLPSTMLST